MSRVLILGGQTNQALACKQPVPPAESYRTDVTPRRLWGDRKRLMYVMAGRPNRYTDIFPSQPQGLREVFGRQPSGTRAEMSRRDHPRPAVAEGVRGFREMLARHHEEASGGELQRPSWEETRS